MRHEELEKALGAAAAAGGCHALGRGVALCGAFLAVLPHFERCYAQYSSSYTPLGKH